MAKLKMFTYLLQTSSSEIKSSTSKSSHKVDLERQKSHKSESDREKKREAEKRTLDKVGLIYPCPCTCK